MIENKKAPAERQLRQGARRKMITYMITENGRKGKENDNEKI